MSLKKVFFIYKFIQERSAKINIFNYYYNLTKHQWLRWLHKKQKRLAENLQEDKLDSGLELSSWASEGTFYDNSDPKFNKTLTKPSLD